MSKIGYLNCIDASVLIHLRYIEKSGQAVLQKSLSDRIFMFVWTIPSSEQKVAVDICWLHLLSVVFYTDFELLI